MKLPRQGKHMLLSRWWIMACVLQTWQLFTTSVLYLAIILWCVFVELKHKKWVGIPKRQSSQHCLKIVCPIWLHSSTGVIVRLSESMLEGCLLKEETQENSFCNIRVTLSRNLRFNQNYKKWPVVYIYIRQLV